MAGEESRARAHHLRHEYDAIMIGTGTALADNPLLTDRSGKERRRPLVRVVLDERLQLGPNSKLALTAEEAPVLVSDAPKIALLHPSLAFLWMSPPCPAPQGVENGRIDMGKGFLGRGVSVKVGPSPYFGIECGNQPVGRGLFVLLDALSDVRQERFDVLF